MLVKSHLVVFRPVGFFKVVVLDFNDLFRFRYARPTNVSSINIAEKKNKEFCSFLIALPGSLASVSPGLEAFFGYGLFTHTRTSETEHLTVLFIIRFFFPALVRRKISFPLTV